MSLKKSKFLTNALLFAGALMTLNGCTSTQNDKAFDPPLSSEFAVDSENVVLVLPDIQEREQYQLLIARLTQLLNSERATAEQRAQILYQLGILYDRLGLDVTARNMFMSALVEVPDYANSYNFIGIYLASSEHFNEAYEAYDAALEINPEEKYAYFNRGIALYYGDRAKLGIADLLKFYEADKNDPFRIAWLYILERTVHGEEYAKEHLIERQNNIEKVVPWGIEVLDLMQGKIKAHDVIQAAKSAYDDPIEMARRLCEAYFYLGKMADFEGKAKLAYDYFHLCVATNVTGYLEYRYAQLEISRYARAEAAFKSNKLGDKILKERNEYFKDQAIEADEFLKKFFEDKSKKPQQQENSSSSEESADKNKDTNNQEPLKDASSKKD